MGGRSQGKLTFQRRSRGKHRPCNASAGIWRRAWPYSLTAGDHCSTNRGREFRDPVAGVAWPLLPVCPPPSAMPRESVSPTEPLGAACRPRIVLRLGHQLYCHMFTSGHLAPGHEEANTRHIKSTQLLSRTRQFNELSIPCRGDNPQPFKTL